jgi:hypothetical protein
MYALYIYISTVQKKQKKTTVVKILISQLGLHRNLGLDLPLQHTKDMKTTHTHICTHYIYISTVNKAKKTTVAKILTSQLGKT